MLHFDSAARLSEISQNVRNFILIADRNFRNFGHEILPKNARNFIFGQKAPENVRILAKTWFFRHLCQLQFSNFTFFFQGL